ncbi:Cytochrome P450 [Trichosporon asahii var. asahii CBS 8904]|uniref:Cytochrome P450 n=1 Tax=Trichosporon asahii var. asahii (strain CBS 8904) TaxID=1220162 RepID=K1VG62_TRIAC|nr:Cytochrome P450 [Trichosporon asahii var. asahii CBS 8904]
MSVAYAVAGVFVAWLLYIFFPAVKSRQWFAHQLNGPPSPSFLTGRFFIDFWQKDHAPHMGHVQRYGKIFKYPFALGIPMIFIADPYIVSDAYSHPDTYKKTKGMITMLDNLFGRGLLSADDDFHKQLRRIIAPAFTPSIIRSLFSEFLEEAYRLQERLQDKVKENNEVDILNELSRTTLDIFGTTGLGQDQLGDPLNRLGQAYTSLIGALTADMGKLGMLQVIITQLQIFPSAMMRMIKTSRAIIESKGKQMIAQAGQKRDKDLLSLLVKSNSNESASKQLSEQQIIEQITTILFAGHETVSTSLSWTLYHLADNPSLQTRLHDELSELPEEPTFEQLDACPLLGKVVREILRVYPPVPSTQRELAVDQDIPLSEPVALKDGRVITSLPLKKGEVLNLSVVCANRDKDVWGPDAEEFNPDRFDRPNTPAKQIPSAWGNVLSFSHGSRNCIGFRFALAEMKALLFVIMRNWRVERVCPVEHRNGITSRPYVDDKPSCPLRLHAV